MNFDEVDNQSIDLTEKKKIGSTIDVSEIVANSFKDRSKYLSDKEKDLVRLAGLDRKIIEKEPVKKSLRNFLDVYDKTKKYTEDQTKRELIDKNSALEQQLKKLSDGEQKKVKDLSTRLKTAGLSDEEIEVTIERAKKIGNVDEF